MPDPQPLTDADRADLVAYLDGELEPSAQQRVEARISLDANARAEADTLKRTWDLLDHLPRPGPTADFMERTLDRVSALRPAKTPSRTNTSGPPVPWYRRAAVSYVAWAAAALLALAIGYRLTPPARPVTAADIDPDTDPLLAREPRVIDNLPLYLAAENLDYLLALDQSDLFADDAPGR
jgi:anti-sigma factor RsiW